jgi:hypothetical protein
MLYNLKNHLNRFHIAAIIANVKSSISEFKNKHDIYRFQVADHKNSAVNNNFAKWFFSVSKVGPKIYALNEWWSNVISILKPFLFARFHFVLQCYRLALNRAKSGSFEKWIEGKTESERIKRLETRLTELEVEKDIIEKRDTLTNENKILKACLSSLKS